MAKKNPPNLTKTLHKLARRRADVLDWMGRCGVQTEGLVSATDHEILERAYALFGLVMRKRRKSIPSLHAHYSAVLLRIAQLRGRGVGPAEAPASRPKDRRTVPTDEQIRDFYKSYQWRRLRYETIKRWGGLCQCCGARGGAGGKRLQGDHIKSLRYYWELRLDPDNIQVLCDECNHGKGAWDETDWRPQSSVARKIPLRRSAPRSG